MSKGGANSEFCKILVALGQYPASLLIAELRPVCALDRQLSVLNFQCMSRLHVHILRTGNVKK